MKFLRPGSAEADSSARPRIELRTKRERLLQMLNEDADFNGDPPARGTHRQNRHSSLVIRQQTEHGAFSQFRGEQPRRSLSDSQMLQHPHPHLFDVAGSEHPRGNMPPGVRTIAKSPG